MDAAQDTCRLLDLDDELFNLILAKLPLQKIFHLRCVCTTWKNFLTDDHIFEYVVRLVSQTSMYTVSMDNGFAAYSPEIRSWHRWTSTFHSRYFLKYNVYGEVGNWLLVEDGSERYHNLYLVNPTKRFQKRLPSLPEKPNWDPSVAGMDSIPAGLVPGEDSKSCKIFVVVVRSVGAEDWYLRPRDMSRWYEVFLCDSSLDSWKAIRPWEGNCRDGMDNIMFYEGALHCIIRKWDEDVRFSVSMNSVSIEICRYDELNSCWRELSAQVSGRFHFQSLFEWQGHLMLIGGQHNEPCLDGLNTWQRTGLASVHIWQLDEENDVCHWVERIRMPDHILDHFSLSETEICLRDCGFFVAICGPHIWLTKSAYVSKDSKNMYKHRHGMCDLSKGSWWEVPEPSSSYDHLGFCRLTSKFGF